MNKYNSNSIYPTTAEPTTGQTMPGLDNLSLGECIQGKKLIIFGGLSLFFVILTISLIADSVHIIEEGTVRINVIIICYFLSISVITDYYFNCLSHGTVMLWASLVMHVISRWECIMSEELCKMILANQEHIGLFLLLQR